MILLRNASGFTEPGISVEQLGKTPGQVQAFSQDLYNYILLLAGAESNILK